MQSMTHRLAQRLSGDLSGCSYTSDGKGILQRNENQKKFPGVERSWYVAADGGQVVGASGGDDG